MVPLSWTSPISFSRQSGRKHDEDSSTGGFIQYSMDFGPWTLDLGPWTLDLGPWTLDLRAWIVDLRPGNLDPSPWTLDLWSWTKEEMSAYHRQRLMLAEARLPIWAPPSWWCCCCLGPILKAGGFLYRPHRCSSGHNFKYPEYKPISSASDTLYSVDNAHVYQFCPRVIQTEWEQTSRDWHVCLKEIGSTKDIILDGKQDVIWKHTFLWTVWCLNVNTVD